MNNVDKNNQTVHLNDQHQNGLAHAARQHEAEPHDLRHQSNPFEAKDNTLHHDGHPHAPIDQSPHQHAPNHLGHEHSNPGSERRYLRDPDTGLWVNQVRR